MTDLVQKIADAVEVALGDDGHCVVYKNAAVREAIRQSLADAGGAVAYLCNGTRFKVAARSSSTPVVGIAGLPEDLSGRWVALVAADDDCHLAATTEPSAWKLRKDGRMWTTHIKRSMENYVGLGAEVTPLYTHPDSGRVAELERQLAIHANGFAYRVQRDRIAALEQHLTESREREGRMREALRNLLQETHEPSCYHVHHAKRDQHEYIEACPVIQRHRVAVGRAVAALAADKEKK